MKLNLSLCAFIALGAACASDTDDRPVSFTYIHAAILKPNCATSGCHSTLTQTAGVDLQDRASAYIVFTSIEDFADIGDLLRGEDPEISRMPPDQPLPNADIDLVQRWLDSGKENN